MDSISTVKTSLRTAICLVVAVCLLMPGCVRRRLMVRSNPPGATVYVDNQMIGTTPCATDFTYYGTREIRLVKSGFETLTVNQPIPVPWYEIPPLDFVSENLVPKKIQDYRTVSYNLTPQVIVPTEEILDRAEQLRQATHQAPVLPSGPIVPGMTAAGTGQPGLGGPTAAPQFVAPSNTLPPPPPNEVPAFVAPGSSQ